MPKYGPDTARLIDKGTEAEIQPGSEVISFRGERYTFEYISRLPDGSSQGKVIATLKSKDSPGGRELYPAVFGCEIRVV